MYRGNDILSWTLKAVGVDKGIGFHGIGSSVSKNFVVWKYYPAQSSYPPHWIVKCMLESHVKDSMAMPRSINFTLLLFRSHGKLLSILSIKHQLSLDAFIYNALGKDQHRQRQWSPGTRVETRGKAKKQANTDGV